MFEYRVTSSNAASVWSRGYHSSLKEAKAAARRFASQHPESFEFEIERSLKNEVGRQYWMMRGHRWEPYDAWRDASIRKPAFILKGERAPLP